MWQIWKLSYCSPSINGFEMEKLTLGWCLLNFGHELTGTVFLHELNTLKKPCFLNKYKLNNYGLKITVVWGVNDIILNMFIAHIHKKKFVKRIKQLDPKI